MWVENYSVDFLDVFLSGVAVAVSVDGLVLFFLDSAVLVVDLLA